MSKYANWVEQCQFWKNQWPVYNNDFENDIGGINLYQVMEEVNNLMNSNDVILTDAGTAYYIIGQNLRLKENQKLIFPGAQADMGFALPASIGVYLHNNEFNIIVITGDGSLNTNLQELASINAVNAKVKFIVLNNDGYLSIRNTQKNYYDNNIFGESEKTGLWFPDLSKIASAYNFNYFHIQDNNELRTLLQKFIHSDKSIIFDIKCKYWQEIIPTLAIKFDPILNKNVQTGLDDMYPFMTYD